MATQKAKHAAGLGGRSAARLAFFPGGRRPPGKICSLLSARCRQLASMITSPLTVLIW